MIRPILEYSSIIIDNCTINDKNLAESVQFDAARVCTGALWNTSKSKLLEELGWETLFERRKYQKAIMLFKVLHDKVPAYVCNILLQKVSQVTNYSLRNANKMRPLHAKTNLYKNSFYPSAVSEWNALPTNITNQEDLSSFKIALAQIKFPQKAPSYWSEGERLPLIWHTRLRLCHSLLNGHTYKYGLSQSPFCSCGTEEDTKHYFLECPKYAANRIEMLTTIANIVSPGVHYALLMHLGIDHV